MSNALAMLLAVAAVVAAGAAAFLAGVVGQLRRKLAAREAELRQALLAIAHERDKDRYATAPLAEIHAELTEAGILAAPGRLTWTSTGKAAIAGLVAIAVLGAAPARAAERLPEGTSVVSSGGGAVLVLDDEYLLIDRAEVANIALMVRDLERCRDALLACDATGRQIEEPVPASTRWATWGGIAAGAFAAGLAAGVALSH